MVDEVGTVYTSFHKATEYIGPRDRKAPACYRKGTQSILAVSIEALLGREGPDSQK